MITIKSPREIELIKQSGLIMKEVFLLLEKIVKPGISTGLINSKVEALICSRHATPTFKGYNGFPYALCISVNDVLIHGFPSFREILKSGDIVSIDVGVTLNGYITDAARTYLVGSCSEETKRLVEVTRNSFFEAMKVIKEGATIGDIGSAIQEYCEMNGYSVPRDYTGHGTGIHLHEDPVIPNYGRKGTGSVLKAGMVLAVEPMVCLGKHQTFVKMDGWTVKTRDGKNCAHYENTLVVTKDGYELFTE